MQNNLVLLKRAVPCNAKAKLYPMLLKDASRSFLFKYGTALGDVDSKAACLSWVGTLEMNLLLAAV